MKIHLSNLHVGLASKTRLSHLVTLVTALTLLSSPNLLHAQGKSGKGGGDEEPGGEEPSASYRVMALTSPDGATTYTSFRFLNNDGDAVGETTVEVAKRTYRGIGAVREFDGPSYLLPPLSGHSRSSAWASSDSGSDGSPPLVVGGSSNPDSGAVAAIWWQNNSDHYEVYDWNDFIPDHYGVQLVDCYSISHDGRFIPISFKDRLSGEYGALIAEIIYDDLGYVEALEPIDWISNAYAIDIHHDADAEVLRVVGGMYGEPGSGGFYWEKQGQEEPRLTHGNYLSSVNIWGEAIGGSSKLFWNDGQTSQELGSLGGTWTAASSLNDLSQVVGRSTTGRKIGAGEEQHAFLWADEHGMINLNSLVSIPGHDLWQARDINNSGVILAIARYESKGSAVLTPVLLVPLEE